MPLPINIHALVPSSTPSILLEARLYLFPCPHRISELILAGSPDALPRTDQLSRDMSQELLAFKAKRLIVASHPWGRIGGTQLDPILTQNLLTAVKRHSVKNRIPTAVVTYNVRGVGNSHGSSALFTAGRDPDDFAAVENWAVDLLGGSKHVYQIKRMLSLHGYSWGCMSAALAPIETMAYPPVRSVMLISPPLAFLPAATYFASRSFASAITNLTAALPPAVLTEDTPRQDYTDRVPSVDLSLDSSADDHAAHSKSRRHSRVSSSSSSSRLSFPPSPILDSTTATLPAPPSGSIVRDQHADPSSLSPPSGRQGGPASEDSRVWTIWGTSDQFTGGTRYQNWVKKEVGIKWKEVEGDHFYRWDQQADELGGWLGEWLDA